MIRLLLLSVTFVTLFSACTSDNSESTSDRPYDPWISRSVLDLQPRMLTIALDDDMWVAYSTQDCALYKAWNGYVNFEGAVYNTAHGPQPVTVGDAYTVNVFDHPWRITKGDAEMPTEARYLGHRERNGHAELMYELRAGDVGPIQVVERVEFIESEAGQPGLQRVFTTSEVPEGHGVLIQANANSIVSMTNIVTDGSMVTFEEEKVDFDGRSLIEWEGHIALNPNSQTSFEIFFISKPTIPNQFASPEDMETEAMPLGYRLIARSDCKTCHNTNVKTIGPAYVDIAEKYPTNAETVSMLANKIKKGGAGIWGIQVMSAHPNDSDSDLKEMVNWILSLDKDDKGGDVPQVIDAGGLLRPADVDPSILMAGVLTEVYKLDERPSKVIAKPNRTPDMAGVMQEFANLRNSDFTDLENDFALYGSGYLYFEESGTYVLRLWSDDGSKLYLNDKLLIDHDGEHGTSSKEAAVNVSEGYYPFRLEYFQGAGDRFLSLNYKTPSSEFITIPSEAIFHAAEGRDVISGQTLPMSVSSKYPGDKYPLEDVHPSYDLSMARPYDFLPKVGGMDMLNDNQLVVCTWDPTGAVYLVTNPDAENPADVQVQRIAYGFAEPLGLKVVDGEIYILQKQELTKLVDVDGDMVADEYRTISNAWKTSANFHEFAFGLEYKDGFFYANLATAIQPGGASTNPQIEDRGKVMKINAETGEVEFLAHGLRTPNGVGFGVDDELFVSDNQGDWLPSSKILHVKPGVWFGSRSVDFEGTVELKEQKPVVWLPQDEIGNSPSTPMLCQDGPYAGQMIHGEVTHGGVKRVFVEEVNGDYQGCVFRFIQGLEAGVNRMTYADDGSLYVGGIGNPGNWAQSGKLWYGLQRLKYNGESTFEMLAVRAKSDGVEIEFTEPLRSGDGWSESDYQVQQWQYIPTENYGGPKESLETLNVRSVSVSEDRRKVFLKLDGMKEDRVVYVHLNEFFVSDVGSQLWSTEAWYTMNSIPAGQPGFNRSPSETYSPNSLTSAETDNGWKLLFNGQNFENWKRFKTNEIGSSWIVENGAIKLDAKKDEKGNWYVEDRGDLITADEYENFEFNLEWKISNCGNSGIMFSVVESADYNNTWETGPEMQILDNTCHPDAQYTTHKAGDLYDMVESTYPVQKPAGEWNKVRLVKKDGKVEQWLNGVKVVEYEMYNETWSKMIANSKFKDMPGFGLAKKGHIALQDHGDAQVWFRNIKIKEL